MTLWSIMRRPICSSCKFLHDTVWCPKAWQKHEWPTWDQLLHNKGHWNQKCKIKKVVGVHRNRPHTNTRETWLLHPKCSLDNAHGFLHDTEFRQFVPEQTCVGGTPQCGPLGSYLSPVLHNKAHSNSGRSQMLYTESGISNVTPVLWPLFTLARVSLKSIPMLKITSTF